MIDLQGAEAIQREHFVDSVDTKLNSTNSTNGKSFVLFLNSQKSTERSQQNLVKLLPHLVHYPILSDKAQASYFFIYCRFDKLIRFGQTLQTLLTDLETARGIKDERNGRLLQVCSSDVQRWHKGLSQVS